MSSEGRTAVLAYIDACPDGDKERLLEMRSLILSLMPEGAEELISYKIPAVCYKGIVCWYSAAKKHYALYPKASPIEHFREELKSWATSRGTIRFRYDQPLPVDIIARIVNFRLAENELAESKKRTRAAKKTPQ